MTRHSWLPVPTAGDAQELAPELAFSRTAGPLLITLDSGAVIGAASQPSLISVTLWLDRLQRGSDTGLHMIEADDQHFSQARFARMLGKRVASIAILVRSPENVKWRDRPRQAGVILGLDGAADLVLSHGLHDDSDDFSVVTRDDVKPSLWPRLQEVPFS